LAAAGIWDEWETGEFVLFAAFNFPTPKNEFVNLMRRTNDLPVDDLMTVWTDHAARAALLRGQGLPTQPGALAEAEKVVWDNEIYDTDLAMPGLGASGSRSRPTSTIWRRMSDRASPSSTRSTTTTSIARSSGSTPSLPRWALRRAPEPRRNEASRPARACYRR
jgi:hypothetical protein